MKNKTSSSAGRYYLFVGVLIIIVHTIVWIFSGNSPFSQNNYNSYVLQAKAWADGFLDLGQNYTHLELAIFNKKYFVSFPPFPSVVFFPFVLLGITVPDGFIALACAIIGGLAILSLLRNYEISEKPAFIITLLCSLGSNLLFVSVNAWVWFIAQNMAFMFTTLSLLCAKKKKGFLAFLFLACAVGCRPFQMLFLPPVISILFEGENNKLLSCIKKPYLFLGGLALGIFYMWLNYARFGNVFEFGHNYLPEFTEAKLGQFSIHYLKQNVYSLLRAPFTMQNGKLELVRFDGFNMFLVSPIFILAVFAFFRKFTYKNILPVITIAGILLCICMHKTMGGWHFGNRYTNDVLPVAIIILCNSYKEKKHILLYALTLFGIVFNIVGTIIVYINEAV